MFAYTSQKLSMLYSFVFDLRFFFHCLISSHLSLHRLFKRPLFLFATDVLSQWNYILCKIYKIPWFNWILPQTKKQAYLMKKKIKKGFVNTNKLSSSILTFFVNSYISKNHLILNYETLQNHDILQSFALIRKFHLIFIRVNICYEEYTTFLTVGGVFRTLSNICKRVSGKLPPG